jgi:hypothetical protein
MSRFVSGKSLACVLIGCMLMAACSTGSPTTVVVEVVPATVDLCLSPSITCLAGLNFSLEVGQTGALLATAKNRLGGLVLETFSYQSSNPAVLTVAGNGAVCAGTWNSLTTPQVCTPGPTGVAQVTATAHGVSSPPVTVYVHPHVTGITISRVPNQPPTLSNICFSRGAPGGPESTLYQAFAFSGNADITSSVGPFNWQSVLLAGQTTSAVTLVTPPPGTPLNQEIAIATAPGITPFFASVGPFHSQPVQFETCPVQSVSLAAAANPNATSFLVNTGTSTTLNATVTDILGMNLVGIPLAWSSSNPVSVSAAGVTSIVYGSVGTASALAPGGGAVIASCTPPTCNGGITPSLPIYPKTAISFTVRSTTTLASPAVYVTSTGCGSTTITCNTTIVPVTGTSTTAFTAGDPILLPYAPNSVVYDPRGLAAYLGVDSSSFGTQGLMTFNGSAVSSVNSSAGKVLAVSPTVTLANAAPVTLVVVSDTVDIPNQVFIYNASSRSAISFLIDHAVAAAFSPDGMKAYIVSDQSCPGTASGGCLLVSSTVDASQTIPLASPATDAAFIGEGLFGYLAGGDPAGASFLPTCFDPNLPGSLGSVNLASQLIRPLPDGQSALALAPPDIQAVTATVAGIASNGVPGCPAPRGFVSIANTPGSAFNLGIGNFVPTQFFISPDGSAAYILAEVLPSQRSVVNITGATQGVVGTTYTYTLTSGPVLQAGMRIVIKGMQNLTDNGSFLITAVNPGTFTVVNNSGINATGENGTGTVTPRFPFVIVFNLTTQVPSYISLVGNATPLSASLGPAGDLLFVGADDGALHVINTTNLADTEQITFPFPQNALCYGPGIPITQAPVICLPDLVAVRP